MGRAARVVAVVALLIAGAVVGVGPGAAPAAACSCGVFDEQQAYAESQAVFVGELASRSNDGGPLGDDVGLFDVVEVRKGNVPGQVSAVTSNQSSACGLGPWRAGRWLFYRSTAPSTEPFTAGSCGGTQYLGSGTGVPPGAPVSTPSPPVTTAPATSAPATTAPETTAPETSSPPSVVPTRPVMTSPTTAPPRMTSPASPAPTTAVTALEAASGSGEDQGGSTLVEKQSDEGVSTGTVLLVATGGAGAVAAGAGFVHLRRRGL